MARDPLRTKLCEMLGIEYPIVAFTHCKDVVAAVTNAGAFAVMGETHHTPDEIAADIKWIREKVGDKPFGIDLVFPASVPPEATIDELKAKIPASSASTRRTSSGVTSFRQPRTPPSSTTSAG